MSVVFYAKTGCGGYGDRLMGLISVYFISKALNKKFFILWESPSMDPFVRIKKVPDFGAAKTIRLIDNKADEVRDRFEKELISEILPGENMYIMCNQNLVQHIYKNINYPEFDINNYEKDIKAAYDKIYTEFLIPKNNINPVVNSMVNQFNNYNKVIGIHIRTGDIHMGVGIHQMYNENSLRDIVRVICDIISKENTGNYALFVTSDYPEINNIFQERLPEVKIFYHDMDIVHIDMVKETDNIETGTIKLLADHITLTKCTETITHRATNFGRTAALIGNGSNRGIAYPNRNLIADLTIKELSAKSLFI